MSSRITIRGLSTMLCGCIVAVAAFTGPLPAQVPPAKRPMVDTAKKKVVHPAKKRAAKAFTVRQAGGEVLPLCAANQPALDSATTAGRDIGLALGREQARIAYDRQHALDSVVTGLLLSSRIRAIESAAMAARERDRQDLVARDEAAKREAERALHQHLARGYYASLSAGATTPLQDTRNGYTAGWNASAAFGWDATDAPYGFRAGAGIDRLNGMRFGSQSGQLAATGGDIGIYSLTGDVKLRVHPAAISETRSHLYVIGGLGAYKVTDAVYGPASDPAGRKLRFNDARLNFGWNAGAGMSLEVGRAELFVESRFVQIRSELSYGTNGGVGMYTSMMPIVVGLNW